MKNTGTVVAIVLIVVLVLLLLGGAGMTLAPHASAGVGFGGYGMTLAPHASAGVGPGMMGGGYGGMMGGYGNQFGFGFNPIGTILSLVFWALIIGGIVLLVIWLVRNANLTTRGSSESPLDILKARYARGEITKERFDVMKQDLQ